MKKETKASKIMKYIASNPRAKARDVAKALKVSVDSVYQATYLAKKKVNGRVASVRTPNAQMSLALFSGSPRKEKLIMTHDNVNHPSHYKMGGIETIDFIEAKNLSYNLGNVVKYITRADYKGNKIEDLKKAQWYLNREVSNLTK
jgi:prolyl-tRNA editing enzyme YbaK/EbsC (Cys-tRNA(Pro) deacylase)